MFPIDLLADLPPPRDDEPPSLRSEIADELADHLQCAYRRELLKDGDCEAAQRRVLDQFGDCKKLARRLWWQAMWSRIMRQRIVSGLQWVASAAALLLAGAVFWQQSKMLTELRESRQEEQTQREALTAALIQLRTQGAPPPAPAVAPTYADPLVGARSPLGDAPVDEPRPPSGATPRQPGRDQPPSLTVKLVRENKDGPPLTEAVMISMTSAQGEFYAIADDAGPLFLNGPSHSKRLGCYDFHLEPDRYSLKIELPDGQYFTQPVLVRDGTPMEMTIVCPDSRKKVLVPITLKPLPDELRKRKLIVRLLVWAGPLKIEQAKWIAPEVAGTAYRV